MQWGALYQRMREQQRRQRATAQVLQRLPCSAQMLRCDYTVRKYYGFIVSYQKHVFRDANLKLVGEVSYIGKSRVTFDPVNAPTMGGYSRAKLIADLRTSSWDAQVFVTNPTNEAGDTFAFGNPFSFSQGQQATPMRPRTIGISISANF